MPLWLLFKASALQPDLYLPAGLFNFHPFPGLNNVDVTPLCAFYDDSLSTIAVHEQVE